MSMSVCAPQVNEEQVAKQMLLAYRAGRLGRFSLDPGISGSVDVKITGDPAGTFAGP